MKIGTLLKGHRNFKYDASYLKVAMYVGNLKGFGDDEIALILPIVDASGVPIHLRSSWNGKIRFYEKDLTEFFEEI